LAAKPEIPCNRFSTPNGDAGRGFTKHHLPIDPRGRPWLRQIVAFSPRIPHHAFACVAAGDIGKLAFEVPAIEKPLVICVQ
jgi:hypothetical protein